MSDFEPTKYENDKSSAGCIRFTTKYSDEMPDIIKSVMAEGGSIVEAAVACRISRETLFRWKNPKDPNYNPEIADAVAEGLALSQAWWEKQGRKGVWGGKDGFVAQAFSFQMKNRFRRDYAENPVPEPEAVRENPLVDALKQTAAEDWKDYGKTEDVDEHGN